MNPTTSSLGKFNWNELATSDLEACKGFYRALLGWEAVEQPMAAGMPGVYVIFKLKGEEIAGAYQMEGPMFEGVAPHWVSYVSVEDVDATLAKALAAGGSANMPAIDVPEVGRIAMFQDPGGASLSVIKLEGRAERPDLGTSTGFPCWNELATHDMQQAAQFYTSVFDWTLDTKDDDPMPYGEWQLGGESIGGMLSIDPNWGPVPSRWAVYVSVEDCDASVAQAQELGGKLMGPVMDIPHVGRFACLSDPSGSLFSVITLNEEHSV